MNKKLGKKFKNHKPEFHVIHVTDRKAIKMERKQEGLWKKFYNIIRMASFSYGTSEVMFQ